MPRPVYASSSWVCVVNPGPTTLEQLRELVAEAYDIGLERLKRRQNGTTP
ncbi:putative DNA-binding protein (MmcQ/YjbR family) [Deinococcus humi]|uniref:Putative DNA-binding protein (MmcQ/YjbR family) n=1 Tax=Deinococcus humi TaxID=662880 RepID=A0A7W8JT63_9DEIO|nr:putative DNA-binding protein (MmcQ/YjbR family) [Deinococcus humi]